LVPQHRFSSRRLQDEKKDKLLPLEKPLTDLELPQLLLFEFW